jgi:transposase-like protein
MGRSIEGRRGLSEQKKYRSWTAEQKIEIVLAGLRGDRSVKEVCREHQISDALFYAWRDKLLVGVSRWRGRRSGAASGSCAARSGSWSGRWVGRPTSSRSRGKQPMGCRPP